MAKGLTSAYVPLGAVGMRRQIADHFRDKVFYGGLTYNSHPLACATALATLAVYEEDDLIGNAQRMGEVMTGLLRDLADRHPCVGAVRSIGLFGIVELVRSRATMEPLAPFNGTSPEMQALGRELRSRRTLHVRPLEHVLHEPAAVDHRSRAARGIRHRRSRAHGRRPRCCPDRSAPWVCTTESATPLTA